MGLVRQIASGHCTLAVVLIPTCSPPHCKAQTPLVRFVEDLLYNKFTTNRTNRVELYKRSRTLDSIEAALLEFNTPLYINQHSLFKFFNDCFRFLLL
jgi:hypothetical protein